MIYCKDNIKNMHHVKDSMRKHLPATCERGLIVWYTIFQWCKWNSLVRRPRKSWRGSQTI